MTRQYLISAEKAPNPGQKLFKARVVNATVPIEKPLEEKAQPLNTNRINKDKTVHKHTMTWRGTLMNKQEQVGLCMEACQHICFYHVNEVRALY